MHTILKLSSLYDDESWTIPGASVLDFRDLEGSNCYCSPEAEAILRASIAKEKLFGVHWIDTGDYHYISKLWMERLESPFALALFDNHPDDQEGAFGEGLLSCGGWVRSAREQLPLMKHDCLNSPAIPGDMPVYLSIDLDVLSPSFARTDWSHGNMTPEALFRSLDAIAMNHSILGVDICGGLTAAKGAGPEDYAVNTRMRRKLADYFTTHPPVSG
ncbi:MAG: hypothetical protein K6E37_05755 [Bacteroidales bacterium]|nr:hypothetical protein [Bacteroidales bacterium]